MQWEKIEKATILEGSGVFKYTVEVLLSRAQVPGGWLVLAVCPGSNGHSPSITFYPDPTHSWDATAS